MSQVKSVLDAIFNSPYLTKIDVAAVIAAGVVLFKFPLSPAQQASAVLLIAAVFMVAKAIESALPASK